MTPHTSDDLATWLAEEVQPMVNDRIERSIWDRRYSDRLWYQVETGGNDCGPALYYSSASCVGSISSVCVTVPSASNCCIRSRLFMTISTMAIDCAEMSPTFWVEYGADDAVNIGDMLLAHAWRLSLMRECPLSAEAVREMIVGQQLDFSIAGTLPKASTSTWLSTRRARCSICV